MRDPLFTVGHLFDVDHIKKLNEAISKNIVKAEDKPNENAIKSSQVKFVYLRSIQNLILPFLDFIFTANINHFGFDLFQLTGSKILNYNTYNIDEEYTWHIDATAESPIKDIKLTCLLNCSETNYEGGDFCLFKDKVIEEVNELIESVENNSNKIHEAADVFYHLLMYLEANDIKIEDVMSELEKRKK